MLIIMYIEEKQMSMNANGGRAFDRFQWDIFEVRIVEREVYILTIFRFLFWVVSGVPDGFLYVLRRNRLSVVLLSGRFQQFLLPVSVHATAGACKIYSFIIGKDCILR